MQMEVKPFLRYTGEKNQPITNGVPLKNVLHRRFPLNVAAFVINISVN